VHCKKFYGLAVHDEGVLKIDGHYASFLLQQAPKQVHIFPLICPMMCKIRRPGPITIRSIQQVIDGFDKCNSADKM